ncbi:MAG: 16S rRNA (cytidine(1402)-2'-O)-methyltransferase [Bacteroidales bacterium]|nr:16S rRNA (cytidine(1402)-2'-O)-methyltransferase [Bacteroidales bacterium]
MGKLYLVPTPIGNLEDITYRAVRILSEVNGILAEDTRITSRLLQHYSISNQLSSFHQFNEHKILQGIIERLLNDETLALVTDAGTPGISDPGYLLVRECIRNEINVETLPGATAFIPALVNSGIPCDKFSFEGFLPHKKGRTKKLKELVHAEYTLVFYEAPYRLLKTLGQLAEYLGENRYACVSRELTKIHEENIRGTLEELINYYNEHTIKGEIVIVVEGKKD